jgi:hypothetical protein
MSIACQFGAVFFLLNLREEVWITDSSGSSKPSHLRAPAQRVSTKQQSGGNLFKEWRQGGHPPHEEPHFETIALRSPFLERSPELDQVLDRDISQAFCTKAVANR